MKRVSGEWECVLESASELGEGALWDGRDGALYWVDIDRAEVHRYDPDPGEDRYVVVPGKCGTVVRRASGGLVVALEDRVAAIDPDWSVATLTREAAPAVPAQPSVLPVQTICGLEADVPENRANDGKCDPAGRFWVGTMSGARTPTASLYCVECDGSLRRVTDGVIVSNGICWSADAGKMYYIDTRTRRIDLFDFDLPAGAATGRRAFAEVPADLGSPDGMTIDSDGNLWVALWGGGAVSCWDGRTGELLALYELPVAKVTSCAFGGEDLRTLYVTTASTGLSNSERQEQPLAGGLFAFTPGVTGTVMHRFCG